MSNFALFVVLFFSLFVVGVLSLAFMVGKYYWGPGNAPPSKKQSIKKGGK